MQERTNLTLIAPKNESEYYLLFRKFRLDALLARISKEAIALYHNVIEDNLHGFKWAELELADQKTKRPMTQAVAVTAWGLVDLAYEAVQSTNDYRGKDNITDTELYFLVLASSTLHNNRYHESRNNSPESNNLDLLLYIGGLLGEQVKMQKPGYALGSATRDLYILLELSKTDKDIEDMEDCIAKAAGTHWKNVITSLLLLWCTSTADIDIKVLEASVNWDQDFGLDDFRAVLNRYTTTYDEVKKPSHTRQIFTTKPYIRTESKKILCINCFLNILINEHAVLWIVRDYYLQKGNKDFPSIFGSLFEKYFMELLETYVEEENFERISECKNSRADWRLNLGSHSLLVEQKSSLLGLAAKQQDANTDDIKRFVNRNIIHGLQQLKRTEQDLEIEKCIKIILLYEGHLKMDLLNWIIPSAGIINDGYFWLVTIDEMEMLLYQYKNNRTVFDLIVDEKIKRQTEKSDKGNSLEQLFQENGIMENQHLSQEKFKYYDNLAEKEVEKRLKSQ